MRETLPLLLVLTAACAVEEPAEPGPRASVTGSFERLDRLDPDSPWVGTELVAIVGPDDERCEDEVDFEAFEALRDCTDCSLTLDVIRSAVSDSGCDARSPSRTLRRYLSFVPQDDAVVFGWGRIYVSDDPDGPWTGYSSGTLERGVLWYHHSSELTDAP